MQNGNFQDKQLHNEATPAQPVHHCANCEIEFPWPPVVIEGVTYCCTGCAAGGPCSCDYSRYRSVNISGVIHYRSEEKQE